MKGNYGQQASINPNYIQQLASAIPYTPRGGAQIVLVDPNGINRFASGIEHADGLMQSEVIRQMGSSDYWDEDYSWLRPYSVRKGTLTIPVKGSLIHDFPYQYGAWATGYEYIRAAVERGLGDDDVEVIAFDINSPGGHVSGCFDLTDYIYESRSVKPSLALVNELGASAAYNIASAATRISVPRTGMVGSIGVVMAHTDYSAMMERQGVKVTFIYAGKHKVEGNSLEPLPDSVKERWQAEVESSYSDFVATVARNRGLSEEAVRNTEAQVYMATEALSVGLVDAIAPHSESSVAIATLLNSVSNEETHTMANDKSQITAEANDEAVTASHGKGMLEGAAAERVRITTILGSEAAKDRPKAALAAALKTNMDADAAQSFLSDLPKEQAEAPKPTEAGVGNAAFNAAMANTPNPELNAGSEQSGQAMSDEDKSKQRVASTLALMGHKKESK